MQTHLSFNTYWNSVVPLINDKVKKLFEEEFEEFGYAISGGKRFRPTLCMLVSDALGGDREEALTSAAVIELAHASTLEHDNVVDEHEERRGNKTVKSKVGSKFAVFMGDGFLAKAYSLVNNRDTARVLGEGTWAVFKGFAKEVVSKEVYDYVKYLDIISLKTAALYATATELGAISARKSFKVASNYEGTIPSYNYSECREFARNYGKYLGLAYQIADDISDGELPRFLSRKEAHREVLRWVSKAEAEADKFPDSKYKKTLVEVPKFMVNAILEEEKSES